MRILLIHNYYRYYGGEDTYFDALVKLLKLKGHEVLIYTKSSNDIDKNFISKIKTAKDLFINKRVEEELNKIIKNFRPQIAHISNLFPLISSVAYDVCKGNKIPMVQSIHTFRYLCPKGTLFREGKFCELCVNKKFAYPSVLYHCYNNSTLASFALSSSLYYHNIREQLKSLDMLVFPSEEARNYHIKYLDLKKKKTAVVSNFVEDPKIKDTKKDDYFIFVGRFSEEKNILWLLDVFSQMPKNKLIAVGNGPLLREVLKYNKFSNIKIKINISKKEVFNLLSKAICTIIPSPIHYEFGPIVMKESFAVGTPVLVPKGGVFLKRVHEDKTGFFYQPNNQESITQRIKELYKNREKIENMSNYARIDYEKNYNPDIHYKKLMSVYSKILRK